MEDLNKYITDLPVMPHVALKILSLAEDNVDLSFHDLEEIIRIDTSITAKILKVANSALYARQTQIKSLEKAISLLGFKTIKNLVLILSATSAFKTDSNQPFFKDFWINSVLTAFYSKGIALSLFENKIADEVFLAGLIHKIGKVALYRQNPEYLKIISNVEDSSLTTENLEEHYFHINHKDLGSEILKSWSFPQLFIDCTKEYGQLNIVSKYKKEIIIVSLADIITKEVISGETILEDFSSENEWCNYLGITKEEFIKTKNTIIKSVENSKDFIECKSLFL